MAYFDLPNVFKKPAKKKPAKKKPAKKKPAKKKPVSRKRRKRTTLRPKPKRTAIARGLFDHAAPYWGRIQSLAAESLGLSASGFLPSLDEHNVLGCGFWGCVFPTAAPQFVLKLSLDATEGPHVALAIEHFQLDPGIAYFHRIWRLPDKVWTDEYGYTNVWVILREEVDVDSMWKKPPGKKQEAVNPKYMKVFSVLEELPECCSCIVRARSHYALGNCDLSRVRKEEGVLESLLKKIRRGPARYVSKLLERAYLDHRIVLGDVHYDNVGLRHHDLREFGVPFHRALVVSDLGDWGQNPITRDRYPPIPVIR